MRRSASLRFQNGAGNIVRMKRPQVLIEEAVALYHADMIARVGLNGTVRMSRSLLGHVDPESKIILREGHLFAWLGKFNLLPGTNHLLRYVADLTAARLTEW